MLENWKTNQRNQLLILYKLLKDIKVPRVTKINVQTSLRCQNFVHTGKKKPVQGNRNKK